jgi:hypothetical protein
MYEQERDAFAETHRAVPGCIFWAVWLLWVVANVLAFTVGESLGSGVSRYLAPGVPDAQVAITLEGRVEALGPIELVPILAGALVTGAVIAIGQGLVLLPFLKLVGVLEWTAATIVGWIVRWIAAFATARTMAGLVLDLHLVGACLLLFWLGGIALVSGVALSYPQAIVLRRRIHHPEWWVAANLAGPLMSATLLELSLYFEGENLFRGYTTIIVATVTGVSTGVALIDFLRHPTTQAEWAGRLDRRRERVSTAEETVLGSTLYGSAHIQPGESYQTAESRGSPE